MEPQPGHQWSSKMKAILSTVVAVSLISIVAQMAGTSAAHVALVFAVSVLAAIPLYVLARTLTESVNDTHPAF